MKSLVFLTNTLQPDSRSSFSWAQRGLQYAPIAALTSVVLPEIVVTQGHLISTWQDARLCSALVGAAYFLTHRHHRQAVLGTMVVGMTVYLPLHVGLGW